MMTGWFRVLLDALLPPKNDVVVAEALKEDELQFLFHPTLAREAWKKRNLRYVSSDPAKRDWSMPEADQRWIVSLFPYKDSRIRSLIRAVKFYGVRTPLPYVGRIAGEYLVEIISDKKLFSGWGIPLLVPMPISRERYHERGYNQVERFAEAIVPFLESAVTYTPKALSRKNRKSQVRILRRERSNNIKGAFFVSEPALVTGRHIILLDDVIESGATMKDARRALRAAGAADVLGIAIAH